jgi:NAD-dependent dihydropyrimidine dehydrogenase PreA subunit
MAALLAEAAAAAEVPAPDVLSLTSQGRCLVYGRDETALDVAKRLAGQGLEVTLLLVPGADVKPPAIRDVPVLAGRLRRLTGHLGAFAAEVEGLAGMAPSSRSRARFGAPAAEPETLEADLVVDLSGDVPLVPAPEKRDGYLRADPRSPVAVAELVLAAGGLVGEFDKPRYVAFRPELCVHSRNRRTGCTRCLDQCPTGAITPAGNTVAIDPYVCAGCGSCSAVCPTGAATYAAPTPNAVLGAYARC